MPTKATAARDAVPEPVPPAADVSAAASPPPDQTEPTPAPEPTLWEYTGSDTRTYPHIPATVRTGAVLAHVGMPAMDGCWRPAPDGAVPQPADNDRPDPGVPGITVDGAPHGLYEVGGVSRG